MSLSNTLEHLGFVALVDFDLIEAPEGVRLVWRSKNPQPTPEELRAAEPAALAAQQAEEDKRIESHTARDDAKRALAALDTIIAGAPTATNAQMKTWVEQLARIQKHHILATLGR